MKALAIIRDDPRIKAICDRMQKRRQQVIGQVEFMTKRAEQMQAKCEEDEVPDFKELATYLENIGKLKKGEFGEAGALRWDMEEGVLYLKDKNCTCPACSGGGILNLLKTLLQPK